MAELLSGLDGVEAIIDDTIIYGKTLEEHDQRLRKVMDRIQESGLKLNKEKCEFSKSRIEYFGHVISDKGISPNPKRIEAICDLEPPKDITELRRIIGMINYLGRFLPDLSTIMKPMTDLLKSDQVWNWTAMQQKAFDDLKEKLTDTPVLAFYDATKSMVVSADASSYGLGAALFQQDGVELRPVAFCSRTLTSTETKYAQIEKECLASVWACEKFERYLIGLSGFKLLTDHKPLVPLINKMDLDRTPLRCQRLLMRLRRFNATAEHIPGKLLVAPDTLSRSPMTSPETHVQSEDDIELYVNSVRSCQPISDRKLASIRQAISDDKFAQKAIHFTKSGWPERATCLEEGMEGYFAARGELTILDGLLLYRDRIVIPDCQRAQVLETIHEGHQGITKSRERAAISVWWPGINKDIKEKIENCQFCQTHKPSQRKEPLITNPLPGRPWEKVSADLCDFENKTYLVVMDYFSRYLEIAYLPSTSSANVIGKLKNMFAHWGVPMEFVSDNGPQFASKEFSEFAASYNFQQTFSSPHYPQSNGEAESAVKIAKRILKQDDIFKALMAYRSTPVASTGVSPCQLIMGRQIRTTLPVVEKILNPRWPNLDKVRDHDKAYKEQYAYSYNQHHAVKELPELSPGEEVRIKLDNQKSWSTMGRVEHANPERRSYIVATPNGRYRRNRRHLQIVKRDTKGYAHSTAIDYPAIDIPDVEVPSVPVDTSRKLDSDIRDNVETVPNSPRNRASSNKEIVRESPDKFAKQTLPGHPVTTRYGRVVKRIMLDDYSYE
ncbi:uncharacterized protein K02A2.6-like [Pecten maximus]|uniref:uncharacterized protein K02A2.6-like n=1 Tax=Pecten maximus TaxID=6579 RepID=UPI0014582899|nr:uncharacterized protein K02A2.6-like [Pecten maximus]